MLTQWLTKRTEQASSPKEAVPEVRSYLPKTEDYLKHIIELNKALDNDDWERIRNNHAPEQANITDPTYHSVNSQLPESYTKMIQSKTTVPGMQFKGISTKMVHKKGNDTFMTKAYHDARNTKGPGYDQDPTDITQHTKVAREGTIPRVLPLAGWGIMTTKNLYHAGKIPHLVEDVHAGEVEHAPYVGKIPVTVHKFAKDYTTASHARDKIDVDPLHARQIGLMDYLTGNNDRHIGNLLISDHNNPKGYRSLIAIDHDRSFHYPSTEDSPIDTFGGSALSRYSNAWKEHDDHHENQLAGWWKDNHKKIYEEMNRNLAAVKDPGYRKYLRQNFDDRFEAITKWAKGYDSEGDNEGFFTEGTVPPMEGHRLHQASPVDVASIMDKLPEDKVKGAELLIDHLYEKEGALEPKQISAIKQATLKLAQEMQPDEFTKFYSKMAPSDTTHFLKSDILMEMKNNPQRYSEQLKKVIKVNAQLPKESRFLNPFWEKHIKDALKKVG